MFVGMNVRLDEQSMNFSDYHSAGLDLFEEHEKIIHKKLDAFLNEDNLLDASALEKDWFPSIDANVFLSHSHKDQELAVAFAGWLYKLFGIKTFIDSCVWGYADDMLRMIDDKYCVNKRNSDGSADTYSYKKRNQSTAHVHMILNTALHKMIDKTECLFFLNTPNSLMKNEIISDTATASPWIYSELVFSRMCVKRKLSEYRQAIQHSVFFEHTDLSVKYKVDMEHLVDIDNLDLEMMMEYSGQKNPIDALDGLYEHLGLLEGER